jgi:hypothetical protein
VLTDGVNYVLGGHGQAAGQDVDAMANRGDALFLSVVTNATSMLVNTGNESRIRYVETTGATGIWSVPPVPMMAGDDRRPGIDALELWGPERRPDADRYSLHGDPLADAAGNRVAIWNYGGTPFVYSLSIANAIGLSQSLLDKLDVDALMVSERYDDGVLDPDDRPGGVVKDAVGIVDGPDTSALDRRLLPIQPGEYILFSIAPIMDPTGATVFDGDEIWVRDGNPANAATFHVHGGYVWNTANDVMGVLGSTSEDITVLESVRAVIPERGR